MKNAQATKAEFAGLWGQEHRRIYGYIFSLVRNPSDTDDLFQKVSLVLWEKFGEYDPARPFFPWACGIARLQVANFLRKRSQHRLYFSDDVNLLLIEAHAEMHSAVWDDRREALAVCIEKLRPEDQTLLWQCYDQAEGVRRAAEESGRSTQSIHNSLRRVREALFGCIRVALAQ